jgi:putative transposon-encoded protein
MATCRHKSIHLDGSGGQCYISYILAIAIRKDVQKHIRGKGIDKVSDNIKANDLTVHAYAKDSAERNSAERNSGERKKVKFEIHGEELIEKVVKASGNSGRVYLPPDWIGHSVKIVRID